eukprot:scaffold25703_cov45-Phaeocystis_antarctica.AAC.1
MCGTGASGIRLGSVFRVAVVGGVSWSLHRSLALTKRVTTFVIDAPSNYFRPCESRCRTVPN